jgi:hypothetical protein
MKRFVSNARIQELEKELIAANQLIDEMDKEMEANENVFEKSEALIGGLEDSIVLLKGKLDSNYQATVETIAALLLTAGGEVVVMESTMDLLKNAPITIQNEPYEADGAKGITMKVSLVEPPEHDAA